MRTRDVCFASLLVLATAGVRGESVSPAPGPQQARNLNNVGSVYFGRGEYARAESMFSQSAAMGEPEAVLNLAATLRAEGRYPEAEKMYQRARPTGTALLGLALVNRDMGHYSEAEDFAHRALEQGADAGSALDLLGTVAESEGRLEDAKVLLRRALASAEQPDTLINLGIAERRTGDLAAAQNHLERAVALLKDAGDHGTRTAAALEALALLDRARGDLKQARVVGTRGLLLLQASVGVDHPEYAAALSNLALISQDAHDVHRAMELFRQALRIDEEKLGPAHPRVGTDLNNLGVAAAELHDYASSESYFRRALTVQSNTVTSAYWMANLASLYVHEGKGAHAMALYRDATRILRGTDSPGLRAAQTLEEYAVLLRKAGSYAEAESVETVAMRIRVRYAITRTEAGNRT
ncbi:MAG: tetratricopeptide repeat protein [Bryobacteraceae bacterium]|jgi:tetratricopeptide (TPR) repeat protein